MKASIIIALGLSLLTAARAGEREVFRDGNVVAYAKTWPLYPILGLHTGASICLTVAGTKYCGVRGQSPYYLDLPQIHSILFVTEGGRYKVAIHIVNLQSKKSVFIDGNGTGFGWQIGSIKDADHVERVSQESATLVTHGGDWKEVITLNLLGLKVERVQTYDYDPRTQTTGREQK